MVLSFAIAAVVVSPVLLAMAVYPRPVKHLGPLGDLAAHAQPLSLPARLIAPGRVTAIGNGVFSGNETIQRNGMYLGVALLVILAHLFVQRWRRPLVKVMAVVFVVAVALSLGTALEVGGHLVALPWRYVGSLPLLRRAVPSRLVMYAFLVAGIGLALWLSDPRARRWRWAAAALALLLLLPNPSGAIWSAPTGEPAFIATGQYQRYVGPGSVVLVIAGDRGAQMLWQAQSDFDFRLAGGYLGGAPPDFQGAGVQTKLAAGRFGRAQEPVILAFLADHNVSAIIVYRKPPRVEAKLAELLGTGPTRVGGVTLFEVPPTAR